jgi:cytochrome c553
MMTRSQCAFVAALTLLTTAGALPNVQGEKIAQQGNGQGAPACTVCHGPHFGGNTTLGAPALAGLPSAFILARLAHYAGPDGHNPSMRMVATSLDTAERHAVADYLSDLPKDQAQGH